MRIIKYSVFVIFMFGVLVFGESSAIQIVSWNVESGGASKDVIAKQIADFPDIDL